MLEREDVLVRRSYPESPPRVEYELTEKGRALLPIIKEMRRFGRAWMIDEPAKRRRPAATRR
jgi:DNA-binding HxlR family transcriptional regulator